VEESRQGKSDKALSQFDDELGCIGAKADSPRQRDEAEVEGVVPCLRPERCEVGQSVMFGQSSLGDFFTYWRDSS
jgi:hypothetical protein